MTNVKFSLKRNVLSLMNSDVPGTSITFVSLDVTVTLRDVSKGKQTASITLRTEIALKDFSNWYKICGLSPDDWAMHSTLVV